MAEMVAVGAAVAAARVLAESTIRNQEKRLTALMPTANRSIPATVGTYPGTLMYRPNLLGENAFSIYSR
jgi:hypothetical protein